MTIKQRVRRWLGLEGPQGLADVLSVKDALQHGQRADIDALADALRKTIAQLNNVTNGFIYHDEVLSATPSTSRVKQAIDAKRKREAKHTNGQTGHAVPTQDQGEGAESAEEMLTDPVADELAARRKQSTEPDVA